MAEPFDTLAEQLAEALGLTLDAGQLAAVSGVLAALEPEVLAQLRQSMSFLGRIDGLMFLSEPPTNAIGQPGSVAIDLDNKVFYGPKDAATGWPEGEAFLSGPQGPAGTITAVTVATGAAGSNASILVGGTPEARTLALTIPRGDPGPTPALSIGDVEASAPGASPDVTLGGTSAAPVLNFTLPRGGTGPVGPAPNVAVEIVMVAHGEPATVTRSGPDATPLLTFSLPSPLDGQDGREVEFNVSATHIQVRYVGDAAWTNLIALAALKGLKGDKGDAFEFDAKPADLASRAAFDAEPEGFTVLVMDTGTVYARIGATAGVWSDGFPFGQTQSDILVALSELDAAPGVLVQTGEATFEKRDVGAGSDANILDRQSGDGRYRRLSQAIPLADVTGLVGALGDKADAGAVLAALGNKADATDLDAVSGRVTALEEVPPPTIPTKASGADVRAGADDAKFATAKAIRDALTTVAVAASGAFALDGHAGINFAVTLSAAATMNVPTNMADGDSGVIYFLQDATGGRTLALHASIRKFGTYTLSTAANAVDRCGYYYRNGVLELTALEKGLA